VPECPNSASDPFEDLSFTSEQQRLAYEDTVHPYSLFAILKETEADLALALLRYKSVVLDSIIEDRLVAEASKESKDRDLVGRLAADKRLLGQLLLQSPNRPSTEPNFISFATLLDANKHFLAEKYTVQYTASGPDLLREIKPAPGTAAVVFANPDFSLAPSQKVAKADDITPNSFADSMAGTEKRGLEGSSFSPLEGTQKECDKLTGLFEAWHWKAESFAGKDASKEALFHVHFPYILHFATHGFFEAATDRSQNRVTGRLAMKLPSRS
jgi:CHAT domain